jgi:hypothetical protein
MRTLRRQVLPLVLALVGSSGLGCNNGSSPQAAPQGSAVTATATASAGSAASAADSGTGDALEAALLRAKECAFDRVIETAPDTLCANAWTLQSASDRRPPEARARLALRYLGDPSPVLRCLAAEYLAGSLVARPDNDLADRLLASAKAETAPQVRGCMLRVAPTAMSPERSKDLVLAGAEDPSDLVRREAMTWLAAWQCSTSGECKASFPGAFDILAAKLAGDPSQKVRLRVCQRMYALRDVRAPAALSKAIADGTNAPETVAACFNGLVRTWRPSPEKPKPTREAFELTLKALLAKPRSKRSLETPGNAGIYDLGKASPKDPAADASWSQAAKPWYSGDRLLAALEDFAADPNANDGDRGSAVHAMKALGAPAATFERLAAKACPKAGEACALREILDEAKKSR